VWIRIPRRDARGVRAAVSGWVGSCEGEDVGEGEGGGRVQVAWRVVGESCGVLGLAGDGGDVFAG
jgi:ribonuclease P/MRP protein subunit POP8